MLGLLNNYLSVDSYLVPNLIVCCFLGCILVGRKTFFNYRYILVFLFIFLYLTAHSMVLISTDYIQRSLLSIIVLAFFVFFSIMLAYQFRERLEIKSKSALIVYVMLVFFGFLSVALGGERKNTIIYSEPSHLALAIAPLFLYLYLGARNFHFRVLIFLSLFSLGLMINNLTMIVLCLLAIASSSVNNYRRFIVGVLMFFCVLYFLYDIQYFRSRLEFSFAAAELDNLSVLVFISGWERALINFFSTGGFGIGFNMLGYAGDAGLFLDRVYDLSGSSLNLYDGGSLAPKIISELGWFGLALVFLYVLNVFILLSKFNRNQKDERWLFWFCVYVSFSLELFVRGTGYFSILLVPFLVSAFLLNIRLVKNSSSVI